MPSPDVCFKKGRMAPVKDMATFCILLVQRNPLHNHRIVQRATGAPRVLLLLPSLSLLKPGTLRPFYDIWEGGDPATHYTSARRCSPSTPSVRPALPTRKETNERTHKALRVRRVSPAVPVPKLSFALSGRN